MKHSIFGDLNVFVLTLNALHYSTFSLLFLLLGYPAGYPTTAPAYTANMYASSSPGYPPGKLFKLFFPYLVHLKL